MWKNQKKVKMAQEQKFCVSDTGRQIPQVKSTSTSKTLSTSSSFISASEVYENVLKLCKSGNRVPPVSPHMAKKILKSIWPSVCDYFSITASYYLNSGEAGLEHFCFLMNLIIEDINNLSIDELNMVWACIL